MSANGKQTVAEEPWNLPYPEDHVPKDVHEAHLLIMAQVPYLLKRRPKDGERLGYTYAAEPDLIRLVRRQMLRYGMTVRPAKVAVIHNEQYPTKSGGGIWNRVRITQTFVFRHVPSGTEAECELLGEGADPGDKTSGKSHTGALKYAIRQFFMIETGDDPDRVSSEEMERAPDALAVSFEQCKKALLNAANLPTLANYRKAYRARNYDGQQIKALEQLYARRYRELGGPPATRTGQPANTTPQS